MRVIVIDDNGNERMNRDCNNPVLDPPAGMTEAEWSGLLVRDLIAKLQQEVVNDATPEYRH